MEQMQKVIELARTIRERKGRPLKQPLRQLTVVHPAPAVLRALEGELAEYVYQETNVREMRTCDDPERFGTLRAEPVFSVSSPLCTGTELRFDCCTSWAGRAGS